MDTRILEMAISKLSEEVTELKRQVSAITEQFKHIQSSAQPQPAIIVEDELMNLNEVQSKLGICYNSLKKLIRTGKIKPLRINERRVRFSKQDVLRYIQTANT